VETIQHKYTNNSVEPLQHKYTNINKQQCGNITAYVYKYKQTTMWKHYNTNTQIYTNNNVKTLQHK